MVAQRFDWGRMYQLLLRGVHPKQVAYETGVSLKSVYDHIHKLREELPLLAPPSL